MSSDFLDKFKPETIKKNLTLASLYLTAYELLKSSVINRIKYFYGFELDGQFNLVTRKNKFLNKYKKEVETLAKYPLKASCLWLEENGVINKKEVKEIDNIRKHRNKIAHELPVLLIEKKLNINLSYFYKMRELLNKIEIWWILNYEIIINPDMSEVKTDNLKPEDVRPGTVILLDYLIQIVEEDYNISD